MSIILTVDSFVTGTKQSGLVEPETLDSLIAEAAGQGKPFETAAALADALVEADLVTRWQVDKLLKGKYRGFMLGRYQLKELLGKGEMSSVYLAEHVRMKRRCAIKVLPSHKVRETSYLGRFHREAEAVAKLDHPNIVRAYDVDMEEEAGTEIHFLVMEYVVGKSLEKTVQDRGQFSIIEAADSIRQAAAGVAHAHDAELIHRDIKPGNLLIDKSGVVKLLDLGLARFFKDQDQESLTIKHDEKVLGTADYLAPEQAVDSHAVDERADIYALGCTLFFALAGRPPFVDGTLVQRLLAHQTQAPPPIMELREDCPPELAAILEKAMAKSPDERFQTARELEQALAGFLVDHGDRAWREKHVEVVAGVRGLDALLEKSAAVVQSQPAAAPAGTSKKSSEAATEPRKRAEAVSATKPLALNTIPSDRESRRSERSNAVDSHEAVADVAATGSGVQSAVEPIKSLWRGLDKQLLVISALMVVAALFAVSFVVNLQATDQRPEPAAEQTEPESSSIKVSPGDVSPLLNESELSDDPAFGLPADEGADAPSA